MSDLPSLQTSFFKKPYDKNVVTPEKIDRVWLPFTQIFFLFAQTVDRNARGLTGKMQTLYIQDRSVLLMSFV